MGGRDASPQRLSCWKLDRGLESFVTFSIFKVLFFLSEMNDELFTCKLCRKSFQTGSLWRPTSLKYLSVPMRPYCTMSWPSCVPVVPSPPPSVYFPLLVSLGVSCCLLLSPGISCCLLLSPAVSWCLLLSSAVFCCLYVLCWCLLYDTVNPLAKVPMEAADTAKPLKGKRVIVLLKTLFMYYSVERDTLQQLVWFKIL